MTTMTMNDLATLELIYFRADLIHQIRAAIEASDAEAEAQYAAELSECTKVLASRGIVSR